VWIVLNGGTRLGGIVGAGLERLLMEFLAGVRGRGGAAAAVNLFGSGKVLSDQGVVVVIIIKFWVGVTGKLMVAEIWVTATEVLVVAGCGRVSTRHRIVWRDGWEWK
jgi:hypothetical protein